MPGFPASHAAVALAAAALIVLGAACSDSKPRPSVQITPAAAAAAPATASSGSDTLDPAPTATMQPGATAAPGTGPAPARPASPAPIRQPTPAPARFSPAAAGGPDPCALVTQAEAEAVLGGASPGPHVRRTALLSQCQYALATAGDGPADAVTVQVFPGNGPLAWQLRRETFTKTNPTVQAVAGVGDAAFWVGDQSALFVTSRGAIFAVRVPGSGASALANAKALAIAAVGRLA